MGQPMALFVISCRACRFTIDGFSCTVQATKNVNKITAKGIQTVMTSAVIRGLKVNPIQHKSWQLRVPMLSMSCLA